MHGNLENCPFFFFFKYVCKCRFDVHTKSQNNKHSMQLDKCKMLTN